MWFTSISGGIFSLSTETAGGGEVVGEERLDDGVENHLSTAVQEVEENMSVTASLRYSYLQQEVVHLPSLRKDHPENES